MQAPLSSTWVGLTSVSAFHPTSCSPGNLNDSRLPVSCLQIFALSPEMSPSLMQPLLLSPELKMLASSLSPPSPSHSTHSPHIFWKTQIPLADWQTLWTSPQERANTCNISRAILGDFCTQISLKLSHSSYSQFNCLLLGPHSLAALLTASELVPQPASPTWASVSPACYQFAPYRMSVPFNFCYILSNYFMQCFHFFVKLSVKLKNISTPLALIWCIWPIKLWIEREKVKTESFLEYLTRISGLPKGDFLGSSLKWKDKLS